VDGILILLTLNPKLLRPLGYDPKSNSYDPLPKGKHTKSLGPMYNPI